MGLRSIALTGLRAADRLRRGSLSLKTLPQIEDFLVLSYDQALGTAIHATPLFEALRTARPHASITVASNGIARDVLRNNPYVDRIIETPSPYTNLLAATRILRREYRPKRPACMVATSGSGRSSIALLSLLAGPAVRIGYTLMPQLYDFALSPATNGSQIERNLRALQPLGVVPTALEPVMRYTAEDVAYARSLMSDEQKGTAILVTCTSGGQPTKWPQERFLSVAKHLVKNHGLRILLPGTAADAEELSTLAGKIGHAATALAGKTTLAQLAALCAQSDIAISLDTGGLHVARTQTLPVVVLAPAWQHEIEWMPQGKPWVRVLKGPWFPPPPPPNYALEEIATDAVIAAADELLALYPPSAEAREKRLSRSRVA